MAFVTPLKNGVFRKVFGQDSGYAFLWGPGVHEFAKRLGMPREWALGDIYPLSAGKRVHAVREGASCKSPPSDQLSSWEELLRMKRNCSYRRDGSGSPGKSSKEA